MLRLLSPPLKTLVNAGMAAWFFGNMAQSSLSSTGAFEVFYDGSVVRLPALVPCLQTSCVTRTEPLCYRFVKSGHMGVTRHWLSAILVRHVQVHAYDHDKYL